MNTDEFLEHHGIKGMHWGVRQNRSSGNSGEKSPSDHAKLKKTAKIAGGVLVAAAVVAGSVYLAKHPELLQKAINPKTKSGNAKKGKEFVDSLIKEPTSPIHAARTKNNGYDFQMKGGLRDPLPEYDRAGFQKNPFLEENGHVRYGSKKEKVAVTFKDPHGRKDRAGRTILHEVIIPESHAAGIKNFEDAKSKAWSLVKDTYDPRYDLPDKDMARYAERAT